MDERGWRWLARDFVRVHGPDARAFLQGQVSQDLDPISPSQSTWTLVLQPQGKVEALARVTCIADDEFVLDTDAGWGDALAARLNRFKLRVKCAVDAVDDWCCVAVRGLGDRDSFLGAGDRVGRAGATSPPADLVEWDDATYQRARVLAGWPQMGAELTDTTIPAEAGQWLVDHTVSFTKGCFTGQELVARIDSRGGNVPRHLRGVRIAPGDTETDHDDAADVGATGATAAVAVGASVVVDGEDVGRVTSVAGLVALAYVKRGVEPPVAATVDGREARVEALPLAP